MEGRRRRLLHAAKMNPSSPTKRASNGIRTPRETDVVFGRGKPFIQHKGNRVLHALGDKYRPLYKSFDCKTVGTVQRKRKYGYGSKREIVDAIIMEMQGQGARFLKQDTKTKLWVEVEHDEARYKVSHLLRSKPVTEPLAEDSSSTASPSVGESTRKRRKSDESQFGKAALGEDTAACSVAQEQSLSSEQSDPPRESLVPHGEADMHVQPRHTAAHASSGTMRAGLLSARTLSDPTTSHDPPNTLAHVHPLLAGALSTAASSSQIQPALLESLALANAASAPTASTTQDSSELLLWLAKLSGGGLPPRG